MNNYPATRKMRPVMERFGERYIPEPNSGCWLRVGGYSEDGYGYFCMGRGTYRAHRVSWIIHRSAIPAGLFVCHKCDVPICVNPDHLFLGTHQDNMEDMARKGRGGSWASKGSVNPHARLTHIDVAEIRKRLDRGDRIKDIASSFSVVPGAIYNIKSGLTWGGVP